MKITKQLVNIILLGLSFMLIFTAFQTMGNIQQIVIKSIQEDDPNFTAQGYISLSIIYAFMSVFNWAAPSVISLIGPNLTMLLSGITYLLFIMNFLLPKTWLLYLASAVIGVGAGVIWPAQGNYLTLNSTNETIARNSGLFWALVQCSLFFGNLFVYFQFQGKPKIEWQTRRTVSWTLSGIALAGLLLMLALPRPKSKPEPGKEKPETPLEALKNAVKLFFTPDMLLLSVPSFYTGLELSFFSGVYGSSIGFTQTLANSKELVGISGIFIGIGEVLGGVVFGVLGATSRRFGRTPIVLSGFLAHAVSFVIVFVNLPDQAPFGDTMDEAIIATNRELAIFCSFLLGFGDSCFNTQLYSILGSVYAQDSASAFALYKFTHAVSAAIAFGYSSKLGLYGQLAILIVFAVLGTISFVWVELQIRKLGFDAREENSTAKDDTEKTN